MYKISNLFNVTLALLLFFTGATVVHSAPTSQKIRNDGSGGVKLSPAVQPNELQNILQPIIDSSSDNGKAVYAFRASAPGFQNYLALVTTNKKSQQTSPKIIIRAVEGFSQQLNVIYDPEFSPDGRYVLFKKGWPFERYGLFQLYVWDTVNNQVKELFQNSKFKMLTYPVVLWSPDSNYLAYVRGGDSEGNTEDGASLFLYIYNWRDGEERLIVKNKTVRFSFSWAAPHNLLYSSYPENENVSSGSRPDIYEVSAAGGVPRLIIKDGYRPLASPDGKWIAFFGSENPKSPIPLRSDWEYNPRGLSLIIAHRDGSKRKAINRESVRYPVIHWMTDNQHLLSIGYVPTNNNPVSTIADTATISNVQVRKWNAATGLVKNVAQLQIRDIEPIPRAATVPQFQILGLTKNNDSLILKTIEIVDKNDIFYISITTLQQIDLQSGAVDAFLKIKSDNGVDWSEIS